MPNWVVNRITIEGNETDNIFNKHIVKDANGENFFDFNNIVEMPEDLRIEKSGKAVNGMRLYLAKFNPNVTAIGSKKDKLSLSSFRNQVIELCKGNMMLDLKSMIIDDAEVNKLKEQYNDKLAGVLKLGEQAFNNVKKYGFTDWYEWALLN